MPPKQMNTRMIKEALRYKFELGHSHERTAMALKISKGVVAKYVALANAAGLDWETALTWDPAVLDVVHKAIEDAPRALDGANREGCPS